MAPPTEEQKKRDNNNNDNVSGGGDGEQVKVYLRLRPFTKLEESKRSKDCIELHDNPKIVTVDSPLKGLFDFTFDMVFDEYASQEEVYRESLFDIPNKLVLDGIHCTVLAYGQTGTGKSHTMFGEAGGGVEMNMRARDGMIRNNEDMEENTGADDTTNNNNNNNNNELSQIDLEITEGMIARVVRDVFDLIQKSLPLSVEVTVRCSYVELYLEKIYDLLQPSNTNGIRIGAGEDGEFCILGASELCCLSPTDVYTVLARGNAVRTSMAMEKNTTNGGGGQPTKNTRSHGIFVMYITQINHETGKCKRSRLYMLEMAGSETGRTKSSSRLDTASSMEARMVSGSFQSVYTYIRAKLVEQGKEKGRIHPNAYANVSKLSKLLKPSFGGNCHTTLICTASPSSYNIDETIGTIKFGQKARLLQNFPTPCKEYALSDYRTKLSKSERRIQYLTRFVKVLSQECRILRKTGKVRQPHSNRVWDAISRIAKSGGGEDDDGSDLHIQIYSNKHNSGGEEKEDLDEATYTKKLEEHRLAREKAENGMRENQSELLALKSQVEQLKQEKQRMERDLNIAKDEAESSNSRRVDLEIRLRTSRYRENEAVVFLRQFRSFYHRLLKSKASHGNGSTAQVIDEAMAKNTTPGAPNLAKLLDIDKLMVESGLIEKGEVGEDSKAVGYSPSEEASTNSQEQAEKAEDREMYCIQEMTGASESVIRALEPGQLTEYRQKLVTTPAGKLAMKTERELQREVLELSHKVVSLQNAVNAEKAMVEALSARQGALGKMKSAQEMNALKTELERKTNDLQAIVWKMNELHLVNKTIDEKLEHRESHIGFLEDHLSNLQTKLGRLEVDHLEGEKKLREESSNLKQQLDGITLKLWQLGESSPEMAGVCRLIVPCTGDTMADSQHQPKGRQERRPSIGSLAEDTITLLENPERPHRSSASTQTEAASTAEISIQTDEPSRLNSVAVEIATQTDEVQTKSIRIQTETAVTAEMMIQTDEPSRLHSVAVEISTQTDEIEAPSPPPPTPVVVQSAEVEIQTDESARMNTEAIEISTQTDEEVKPVVEGKEIAIQTDEEETKTAPTVSDISTQTEVEEEEKAEAPQIPVEAKPEMVEISTQTVEILEAKPELTAVSTQTEETTESKAVGVQAGTQTDELPNEIALVKTESSASLELTQHDGDPVSRVSEHRKNPPPKPRSFDSVHSTTRHTEGDHEDLDASIQLQNSVSSINSFGMQSTADGSSHEGKKASSSAFTQPEIHSRLGASMSALHGGHTHATVDWRSRMRQQGKDTASTPQPTIKEKLPSNKSTMPRPPLSHSGMMSQPILSHVPSPTARRKQNTFGKKKDEVSTSNHTPEWLSKYKEMGIKAEEEEASGGKKKRPPKNNIRMPAKPKSMMNITPTSSSTPKGAPKPPASDTPEWMSKFKSMGIKADENEPDPEPEPEPVLPPPKEEDVEPEWKKQFKKIGMKGEEVIVEGPPPPEKKPPPTPPKPKTPEWMLKFKAMGIDGGEAK